MQTTATRSSSILAGRIRPFRSPGSGELVVNKSVTIRWVPTVGYNSYLGVDCLGTQPRVLHQPR